MGYQKKDDALWNSLAEENSSNLAYVDHYGQTDSEVAFLRQKSQCLRRYHMRYASGCESSGDRRVKLPTLLIGKLAIQRDILEGHLGRIDTPNGDREGIHQ